MDKRLKIILFILVISLVGTVFVLFKNKWKEDSNQSYLNYGNINEGILKGQLILMADGSYKNIENIKTGDEIASYNENTRTVENDKVMNLLKGSSDEYIIFNGILKTSKDHVIWANGQFRSATDIKVGDFILNSKRQEVAVTTTSRVLEKSETYNFVVRKNHNYFAGDFLVHNPCSFSTNLIKQSHFKIYRDDGGINLATQYASEDTNYDTVADTNFRIRFELSGDMQHCEENSFITRRLEFKEDAGAWTRVTTNSNNVRLQDSPNIVDGDVTTSRLTPAGAFLSGQGKDTGSDTIPSGMLVFSYVEDEYSLKFQLGAVGHVYQFRITKAGSPLGGSSYLQIPTISPTAPIIFSTLTTPSASSISTSTATLNGSITDTGGADATESGFAYGTSPDLSVVIATSTLGAQIGTASFNENISGLTPNTTYYVRSYSTNIAGIGYGTIETFTTLSVTTPTITTEIVSDITNTSITASSTITATGNINPTIRGFVYGTTDSYGATTTETGDFTNTSYTAPISSLTCNTLYHIAGYATNSIGTGYGSDQTFTTGACPVTITPTPQTSYSTGGSGYVSQYFNPYTQNNPTAPVSTQSLSPVLVQSNDLYYGRVDTNVKHLQKYLNDNGYNLAIKGPGSAGNETNFFGSATKAALARFQKAHGITPSIGYFGPVTRGYIKGGR